MIPKDDTYLHMAFLQRERTWEGVKRGILPDTMFQAVSSVLSALVYTETVKPKGPQLPPFIHGTCSDGEVWL